MVEYRLSDATGKELYWNSLSSIYATSNAKRKLVYFIAFSAYVHVCELAQGKGYGREGRRADLLV